MLYAEGGILVATYNPAFISAAYLLVCLSMSVQAHTRVASGHSYSFKEPVQVCNVYHATEQGRPVTPVLYFGSSSLCPEVYVPEVPEFILCQRVLIYCRMYTDNSWYVRHYERFFFAFVKQLMKLLVILLAILK